MFSITLYALAAFAILIPNLHAQYSGSNFFNCYDVQLPNGTFTSPRCCVNYTQSTDNYYTGTDCVGGSVSEDSSIYYCANGNPINPPIPGAVNSACCGWYANTTSYLCTPKPVASL
ncbi:hypothetical protein SCAR479_13481 [Seiridium cardinale]|uniref:Uncharacterized protein n=1 Tax=Seiridium cardinale TaxID=138064 RepID=A0ABR2X7T5_9PEZI